MQILAFKRAFVDRQQTHTHFRKHWQSVCTKAPHRTALISSFWQKKSRSPWRLSLLQQPAPAWGWPLVALLVSLPSQHQLTFFYYFYISWISVHLNTVLSSGQCNPKPCRRGLWSLMNEMVKAVQSWKALSAPKRYCGWNLHLRTVKNNYLRNKIILHFVVQFCRQQLPKNCLEFRTQVAEMQLLQSTERDVGPRHVVHGAGDTSELAKQVNSHGHLS